MPSSPRARNLFFPLAAALSGLFVVTILAMVASLFGDPAAPPATFLDRYAGNLLAGEVVGIMVTGFLALAVDRRQTLRACEKNGTGTSRSLKSSGNLLSGAGASPIFSQALTAEKTNSAATHEQEHPGRNRTPA